MDTPSTVTAAIEDRPVAGRICLEAGAGGGNATAGLLDAAADRVYAVTNDHDDAQTVRERVREETMRDAATDAAGAPLARTSVLLADLRRVPLPAETVELITAHGLCNVLSPAELGPVAAELTRVAAPGCHLVVDDYDPLPGDAAVRDLFAVENAAAELADNRPALTFYPAALLRRLFSGYGWTFDRERTLLDPVPWTGDHVGAHAAVAREAAADLPPRLSDPVTVETDHLVDAIGSESAGRMYSLAFQHQP